MASSEESFNATITNLLSSIPSNMEENLRVLSSVISQGPVGPKKSIITNDPNDPRLKSYADSLKTYNNLENAYTNSVNLLKTTKTWNEFADKNIKMVKSFPVNNNLLTPTDKIILGEKEFPDGNAKIYRAWKATKPVQPVIYEESQPRVPGDPVLTPVNKPSITDPLFQLETATKILDQLKEGDYSVTFGDPTKTESQKTKTFANKAAFEAFISAMAEENNSPVTITRFKNGAQALFTRESTKDKPVGM